ncbi:hypothetical protein N3K66_006170 [Trichothecium roseum]|uniref:Uncharacterized protein n=1 Tax=Trichothecium roseum TaxID=47278 RepID=A0ACC0UZX2_9HYPO|nr:hypothetical protein N3K66_006170 [Trichothecium roseum]
MPRKCSKSQDSCLSRSFTTQVLPVPWPKQDFTGKTVLVTGANAGIGREAARHFVRLNARRVILGCRDLAKAEAAKKDIEASSAATVKGSDGGKGGDGNDATRCQIEVWQVDLGSFASVKSFCRRAEDELDRLDVVVENAGLLSQTYHQFEGYERQCTVNIISTWLMALLLLPVLRRTSEAFYGDETKQTGTAPRRRPHLCIVGSNSQFYTKFEQRNEPSIFEAFRGKGDMHMRYANTKLVSLMIMRELVKRTDGKTTAVPRVIINMPEPGFTKTELMRESTWPWYVKATLAVSNVVLARSSEMASRNYVWAASAAAGPGSHGLYVEDCKLSTPAPLADTEEGRRLQVKVFDELAEILERIQPGILARNGLATE